MAGVSPRASDLGHSVYGRSLWSAAGTGIPHLFNGIGGWADNCLMAVSPNQERIYKEMRNLLLKLYVQVQNLRDDRGQDLIEYALIAALIALAATAGMKTVANDINAAFTNIGNKLTTYTS